VIAVALLGCGPDPDDAEVAEVPTWSADVAPVVAEHCGRCHDGTGVGPLALTTYEQAVAAAGLMEAVLLAGTMPPPAADPECAEYDGADGFTLDDDERGILLDWLAGDTPEGEVGSTTVVPAAPHIERVDVEALIAAPYVPDFDGLNEYRCFQLDTWEGPTAYISALEPVIDATRISHHTLLFFDSNGASDALVTDPVTRSWRCPQIIPDAEWPMVHAWAPGNNPVTFPEGMGLKVESGWTPILQMHYFRPDPSVDGLADQSGYRFMASAEVDREILFFPYGPEGFVIPAGKPNHREEIEYGVSYLLYGLPFSLTVYGIFPHMHVLGKAYEAWGTDAEGERICISEADEYEFNNQPTYMLTEPITVPNEGTLGFGCRWDNSESNPDQINDPVADVGWGENTEQEMCYGLMYVTLQ
jgi:hypothetical protein